MASASELFLNSTRKICPDISDRELDLFASKITLQELNKKDLFLETGKIQKVIGFIAQGLVRSFYTDPAGNEITVGFYSNNEYATHYDSFLMQKPSRYTIQCLEPTIMVCLSFEDMQWLYHQSHTFERYGRIIAEKILKGQQARIESFIFQTAEERYLDFTSNQAGLFNRISLSHLCSYLGIERQTLTRIRHKIAHQ